jgi:phosphopantetheinyl transferase/NAD(P)-dependent dehydrogenase (short-subunit alcohol dehydrogenase family)
MLTDAVAARLVLDEVVAGDGAVEIFHDGEQRRILTLRLEEMPPAEGRLREGSIIVVTGGTRGITAQVAIELARRGPVRLALLARTLPGSTPLDEEAAKATIRAELEAAGERATPARIDQRLRPLRVAEEGRLTVAALRELGAEVRTFVVDMADEESVREYLHRVRDEWGRIDGVIHGAGVEESRLLSDKDLDAFRRVFDGKARGGMAIARNLERGAWFLSMGSVAGRFGNAGQVDYAAANEGLARVALSRPRSLHVDWTAWADAGMAVRGGMERLLTEKGVELLPALAGARLTVDLLAAGVTGEVLVAGRLGDFSMPALHPLVDRIELLGDLVLGRRSLSLASDPWLADHAIDGVPVLPGVIGLELLAATAAHLRPGEAYVGARAVSFRAPVKVHRDEPVALTMAARLIEGGEVAVRLSSERVAKTGRPLLTHHFEAILRFGEPVAVDALPSAFLPEEPIDRAAIYRRFFHGPGFQVLSECGAVASNGLMAEAVVSHDALGGAAAMLTAPLLLEAAFQAAGLHHMAVHGALALPAGIEALVLESRPADGEPLGLMVSERADGRYDIDLDGPSGIALRVRGFSMAVLGPLPPADRFTPPRGGWPQAVVSRARPVGKKSGGAQALHPAEQALIAARGRPERQAERVLGRLAAQQALIGLLGEAHPVLNAEGGAPYVVDHPELVVSISHSAGDAFAAVATSGRLGLDLEQVVLRHPSFARTWFTDAEQALADEDCARTTAIWAVKEAVLKALGAGMRLSPNEIEVTALRGRRAWVSLQGRAAALHAAQGGGPVVATLTVLDTAILATVYLRGAAGPLPALARCA